MHSAGVDLVLASQSPRRRELLDRAGFRFVVRAVEVEELRADGESPMDYVRRLARSKAEAVELRPGEVVLGADTIVVVDGEVLEKPTDARDARRMLRMLSGRAHQVLTGVCLRAADKVQVDVATTIVVFQWMAPAEIDEYVASGEPEGKAGAYAIQGRASKFVDRIEGCYFNVVGLPVSLVYRMMREI